ASIEMLEPGVFRNADGAAFLPLDHLLGAVLQPDGGSPTALGDVDGLREHVVDGIELPAGGNLADVAAAVLAAMNAEVYEGAAAAVTGPIAHLDVIQVADGESGDDR